MAGAQEKPVTTLMFKNLPKAYTPQLFMAEIAGHVDASLVDFVYVPWSAAESQNMGFAFVNFSSSAAASQAMSEMAGKAWQAVSSGRSIKVGPAHVQGLAANLSHCAYKIPLDADGALVPLVRHQGREVSFATAVRIYTRKVLHGSAPAKRGGKEVRRNEPERRGPHRQPPQEHRQEAQPPMSHLVQVPRFAGDGVRPKFSKDRWLSNDSTASTVESPRESFRGTSKPVSILSSLSCDGEDSVFQGWSGPAFSSGSPMTLPPSWASCGGLPFRPPPGLVEVGLPQSPFDEGLRADPQVVELKGSAVYRKVALDLSAQLEEVLANMRRLSRV